MDVHTPEKAPRTWREFVVEIAVIVLGVLIALGAEQLVQEFEWRQKIQAAEDAMTAELRNDVGPQAYARAAIHTCLTQRLDEIRAAVESDADRATVVRLTRAYKLPFWTWDSLGLQAANSSSAFSRMSAARAQGWTLAYAIIPAMDRANEREFRDQAELHALSATGGPLSADERTQVLRAVALLRQDEGQIYIGVRAFLAQAKAAGVRFERASLERVLATAAAPSQLPGDCIVRPGEDQGVVIDR